MTTKYLLLLPLFFITQLSMSQDVVNVMDLQPKEEYENIKVEKIHSDSLSTSFIIWIKEGVNAHKHVYHSETIYVLEGEGIMRIGNENFKVRKNDFFNIPPNTIHALVVNSEIPMKVISFQTPEFLGEDRIFVE